MHFFSSILPTLLVAGGLASAASSWSFEDAVVSVSTKGVGVDGAVFKEKLTTKAPLSKSVSLGPNDNLKVILTAKESGKSKRPHQAFLLLKEADTGLEATFPLTLKESGKGKVDIAHKDLPLQLLLSTKPLEATVLLASFGSSEPYISSVFKVNVGLDANSPQPKYEKAIRYGKQPAIDHIFKADPTSPPIIISLVFAAAVLASLPILLGAWLYLEANLNQLQKALSGAPVSHALFFGSIVSMEVIFALYYYSWTLFEALPAAGVVGIVAFVSGSKALSEVQSRRLAGDR